ncbi:MAG: carbohydrate binding domain-containing protein, partial [Oscillospiraceae bacterium]|nr:carbohydrate binding domain-containing protein [Oscillospiraceae bacterium]
MTLKKLTATLTAILCAASTFAAFPAMNAQAAQAVYNDFEVTYNGWHGISDEAVLEPTEGVRGTRGLAVTGRTSALDGAASSKGFYLAGGILYTYNVKVQADTEEVFHLSVRTIDETTGEETVKEIASKSVKAGEWANLSAKYK